MELAPQRVVADRYELEALLKKGGMGEVWRARHLALKQPVAIKFLVGAHATTDAWNKRFLNEAQVTASLKSRHAVKVFDFGITTEGVPYLVMELLEGHTLRERIEQRARLSTDETVRILAQAARALDRAHALGIVHRDFKPDNVMIVHDEDGGEIVKVVDFGIARLAAGLDEDDRDGAAQAPDKKASTRTSSMLGTPFYMAPEQIKGTGKIGPAADVWALGVVAFECLTGQLPFEGENLRELFQRILRGEHPKASELAGLPPLFDDWFEAACAPDPSARLGDAPAALAALSIALDVGGPNEGSQTSTLAVVSAPPATTEATRPTPMRSDASLAKTIDASTSATPPLAKRSTARTLAAAIGVAALAIALVAALGRPRANDAPTQPAAAPSATNATTEMTSSSSPISAPTSAPSIVASSSAVEPATTNAPASAPIPGAKVRAKGAASASPSASAVPASMATSATPPTLAPTSAPKASAPASPFQLPPLGL